ncbi:hypothetical protein [Clostridium saccharoperbutylacetonicum]|uniref:hypothetical protein n=1 Tax=Clostridium saccharoperbutylacetonicum TaxID=36745 RepID=UPI000983BD40|nr:hypothetical protein [Clostridium saccharoperbutylacetonicum]AQR96485.1 hypothetical protein CLSAP_38090 [Clostridium saccharoperbutylacetonicum]NSB32359.1 hypothetical protein [Clostridium saccharoperbutylacetonicum]
MNMEFLEELKKLDKVGIPYDKDGKVNKNFGNGMEKFLTYYLEEKSKYIEYFDELVILIKDLNPVEVLSYFSFERIICSRSNKEDECLDVFQLEILQYIMVCNKPTNKFKSLDYKLAEEIKQYLFVISFLVDKGGKSNTDSVKRKIMSDTAFLRVNHVPKFDIEINKKLFALIDKSTNYELGLSISLVIDMFCKIIKQIITRVLDYHEHIVSKRMDIDVKCIRSIMTYSVEEFAKAYGEQVKSDVIESILDKVSFRLDDNLVIDYENIFYKNPIWTRFLIKENDGRYFFPITESFIGRIKETLEYLIQDKQTSLKKYNDCKGAFLEEEVVDLFKSKFTNSEIFTNSSWVSTEDGKVYENDVLVIYKNYAIIVEAKGNNISCNTKEGNIDIAKKDVGKIIKKAAIQANGFKNFLIENKGKTISLKRKGKESNKISLINVNKYLCLSVSINGMESLGNSQLQWLEVWNENDKDIIIPHIQLGHLKVIFDILENESEIIHYLKRRTSLDKSLKYTSDELDLLNLYLESGLNFDFNVKGHIAPFMGYSQKVENYYFKLSEKPKCKRTELFRKGLEKLRRISINSTDQTILLLDIAYKGQKAIETDIIKWKKHIVERKIINPIYTEIIGNDHHCLIGVLYWHFYSAEQIISEIRNNNTFNDALNGTRDEIYVLGIEIDENKNYSCGFVDKIKLK